MLRRGRGMEAVEAVDAVVSRGAPMQPLSADPLDLLRARTSEKWATYPDDVLPLFVAETDYPIAPAVADAVIDRVRASDTGYVVDPGPVARAFAGFAGRRWGWQLDAAQVRCTTDVSVAVVEALRALLDSGSGVVIMPPVYPPFFALVAEAGHHVVEVPVRSDRRIDLDGVDSALADGARGVLLCHPHNPLGVSHPVADLEALADLARRHGAVVVSDEIHGPLAHTAGAFTPYLAVSENAARTGVCVTSASKGWNIAGFKCALVAAADDALDERLRRMPADAVARTSILGLHASAAAFEHGDDWLDATVAAIVASKRLLTTLLEERLPGVGYREPDAGYLAWLDLRELGWGDDPGQRILAEARVALASGSDFGRPGRGHVRLNLACSPDVLTEAIARIARLRD
jgi:cystathionine beta-lyase